MIEGQLWIGGEVQPAASGERMVVTAPADDRVLGSVPRGGPDDVDRAVGSARRAWPGWAGLAGGARERVLLAMADRLAADGVARLLDLLIDESGSTITKARGELAYAVELLRAAAGEARRLHGDTFPDDRADRLSLVLREPLGVVAVIAPFNAPVALLTKMLAFPLAAGNTVVVKPSEHTPLCALALARLFAEAGLPPGVLAVVTGDGPGCGAPLAAHPDVDGIAFTGATATGCAIAAAAAPRLARLQLELGGKNPLLVLRDADPVRAAAIAVEGGFAHAGQICMASSRLIVERPIYPRFLAALIDRCAALHLGDLRDERTAYGPVIDDRAVAKIRGQVEEAIAAGAGLGVGGRWLGPRTLAPTVLVEPPSTCRAWREETFGPVVSVVAVDDLDQAIAAANDSAYALAAAVVTDDLRRGLTCVRRIRAGAVHLGMHSFQSGAIAPVGGRGLSGIGRSGGRYSIEHFTELKWARIEVTP